MILFYDDWFKYDKPMLHLNTKNTSFLRLAHLYREMGIRNHGFILTLLQPELEHINPHNVESLTPELMAKIVYEIKYNPWYFFREVAKAPALAGIEGEPFKANRANIALYWLFFNHITTILIQPRQTGKSFSTDTLMIYLLNFGTVNTLINMLTRSSDLRTQNLDRLKKIQEELPYYLNFKSKNDIFNTEEIRLRSHGNSYKGNLSNMSPKLANNVGRGFTSPILHVDETCFIPNIEIALTAALMAGNAAREAAKNHLNPYGTILTTTTGKIDDRDAKFVYKLWNSATIWNEKFFDATDITELQELIYTNSNSGLNETKRTLVNITMSYKQLGYDDNWMREKLNETIAEGADADRDLFNRWTSGTTTSPIPKEYIELLRDSINDNRRVEIYRPYNYILNWYIDEEEVQYRKSNGVSFIIGIDTSDGIGKDDIALVMRDSSNGEVICTATFNELNLITLSDFFVNLLIKYENSVMIIERRSSAVSIIDYMLTRLPLHNINPFKRLYNTVVQNRVDYEDEYKSIERITYNNESIYTKLKKHIGFTTSGSGVTSRSELYSTTLIHMLKYTCTTLYDSKLIHQILGLTIKNGRVDHADGNNDDLVVASLLSYWLLLNGKNLHFYNIDTQILLKANKTYLTEKYSDSNLREEEFRIKESEFLQLIEQLKQEKNTMVAYQIENKIRYIAKDLVNNYNKSISVEHMLDDINREKRLKRGRVF